MTRTDPILVAGRPVGRGHPTYLIAEVGLAHEGSLGTALAYVDAAADAGAHAVKFQTHIPEAESTARETFRVRAFPQDNTRFEYWKRTSFTPSEWAKLRDRAEARGVHFLSTPFSHEAARLLMDLAVPAWKVGSGDVSNLSLLEELAATGLPLLLSSGMSSLAELDRATDTVRSGGGRMAIFQCTSQYPCPPEMIGLNLLHTFRDRYGVPIGLSDHSGRVAAGIAARALGADAIEVHVTFHRKAFGPDVSASLTIDELGQLAQDLAFIDIALMHSVDKDEAAQRMNDMRTLFTKSVVAARDLKAGTVLKSEHLALKKPGDGMPASAVTRLVGRTLLRRLEQDEQVTDADVEPEIEENVT